MNFGALLVGISDLTVHIILPIYLKHIYDTNSDIITNSLPHPLKNGASFSRIRYVSLKPDLSTLSKIFSFSLCLPREVSGPFN